MDSRFLYTREDFIATFSKSFLSTNNLFEFHNMRTQIQKVICTQITCSNTVFKDFSYASKNITYIWYGEFNYYAFKAKN